MKICPECKLSVFDEAENCECGYSFKLSNKEEYFIAPKKSGKSNLFFIYYWFNN